MSDVWAPPLIIFLQFPFNLKSFWFLKVTWLVFLTFITAHSPVVVDESSRLLSITFSIEIIFIFFKLLLIIIGAVVYEVKFKFCKYKFTEATLILTLPSNDVPVTK